MSNIEKFLQENFNFHAETADKIEELTKRILIFNILSYADNEELHEQDLEIKVYKVKKDECSESYFQELIENGIYSESTKWISVYVEEKTGYFETESNRMFLEINKYLKVGTQKALLNLVGNGYEET